MSDNSDQGTRSRTNTSNRKRQSDQDAAARSERSSRRRTPSGNRRQQQRGASGGSNAPRGKTIPWQKKVRRFLRRAKKFFRRLLRRLQRLPLQIWLIAGGVLAAVIVIIIVVNVVFSGRKSSAAEEETQVVEETEEGEETAAEEEEETSAATVLEQLQGIDYYTILTDASQVESLTYTQISPLSCTASSVLTGVSGTVFGTDNLFDNDLTTSWQEGEDDDGLGVTITSTFASGTEIIGIAFWIGNEKAQENYDANNRPQGITVSVSSSSQVYSASYTLEDYMGEQILLFASAVPAESIVIRIDSVYEGTSYDDTVISELRFLTE